MGNWRKTSSANDVRSLERGEARAAVAASVWRQSAGTHACEKSSCVWVMFADETAERLRRCVVVGGVLTR